MQSAHTPRRIFSSTLGFIFLLLTFFGGAVILATVPLKANVQGKNVVIVIWNASIGVWWFLDNRSYDFFCQVSLREAAWDYRASLWPFIEHGSLVAPSTRRPATVLYIPIWMFLVPSALASWYFYHRARRKRLIGCCKKCGYNLTGNTTGVCPECGATIPPAG